MQLVLVVVALALSGCWAGLRLAIRAKGDHHQNELHRTSSRCLENDAHRLQLCKHAR